MSPSLDGVSIVSFTSRVCTDIRWTVASGFTRCSPDGSASDRTFPKRSTTPTSPAGTMRAARSTRKKTKITRIKATAGVPRFTPRVYSTRRECVESFQSVRRRIAIAVLLSDRSACSCACPRSRGTPQKQNPYQEHYHCNSSAYQITSADGTSQSVRRQHRLTFLGA